MFGSQMHLIITEETHFGLLAMLVPKNSHIYFVLSELYELHSIYQHLQHHACCKNMPEQCAQLSDISGIQNNQVTSCDHSVEVKHLVYIM